MIEDRFEELLAAELDGEIGSAERAELEVLLESRPGARARLEAERALRERLRSACREGLEPGKRDAIWARFEAAAAPLETPAAPVRGFGWRIWGLPAAAAAAALLLWFGGFLDGRGGRPEERSDALALAHTEGTIFAVSPVMNAVLDTDRGYRDRLGGGRDDADYPKRLSKALDGAAFVKCWLGTDQVETHAARVEECRAIVAECLKGDTEAVTPIPSCARIDAASVHEVELDGTRMRIPHFVLTCRGGREISLYFLCAGYRPQIEAAMARCETLRSARLEDGRPVRMHRCEKLDVVMKPRGAHLLVFVSQLPTEAVDEVVRQF